MSVKFGLVLIHRGDGGHRREGRSCRLDRSKGMNVLALPKKIVCMYVGVCFFVCADMYICIFMKKSK